MNTSQLVLLFASFIILSMISLMVNNATLESHDERLNSKNQLKAMTEAKNLFEVIKTKSFDEKIYSMVVLNRDSLTASSDLGPENETFENFDDIDDYHGYSKELILENNVKYELSIFVSYVNENNPELTSSAKTFYKLVRIICLDQNQNRVFELKQIFSIW